MSGLAKQLVTPVVPTAIQSPTIVPREYFLIDDDTDSDCDSPVASPVVTDDFYCWLSNDMPEFQILILNFASLLAKVQIRRSIR